jgi:hypothetical protein
MSQPRPDVAYYTIANAPFFPGVVGLLNSLRLIGEEAPLYVVDCGLTRQQQETLSQHVTLVPSYRRLHPVLQKATGPLAHAAEIMVLIDADIVVTRSLSPLFESAANGEVVAVEDYSPDRFFSEWVSLGLGAPRRRPYVNCGLLIFSAATASDFLPLFVDLQERLDPASTHFGGGGLTNPFYFADQDILNAILCTRYDGRVKRLDIRFAPVPPFAGLQPVESNRLSFAYGDGLVPYALHHTLKKPWLSRIEANAYSDLFTKMVTDPEARLRLEPRELPLRLRETSWARVDRLGVSVQLAAWRRFRGRLGLRPAIERRVRDFRRQRASAPGASGLDPAQPCAQAQLDSGPDRPLGRGTAR